MDAATREIINRPSGSIRVIYASRLMKGWEAAQAVQSFMAQANSRPAVKEIVKEGGLAACLR